MDHYQSENTFHGSVAFRGQVDLGGFVSVLDRNGVVPAIVADVVDRANYLSMWMEQKQVSPSRTNPCVVFREDGSMLGLLEICVDPDAEVWAPLGDAPGTLTTTLSDAAPYGWYLCHGQLLTPSAPGHAPLWASCPDLREGANIRLPDMRARTAVGAGPALTSGKPARGLGDTGGAETVKLSKAETPLVDHLHAGFEWTANIRNWIAGSQIKLAAEAGSTMSGTGRSYASLAGGSQLWRDNLLRPPSATMEPLVSTATDPATGAAKRWPTSVAGREANAAHENMPPFLAVNYLIKA